MSARHTSRELANKYVGPLDTASFSGVSHCQRIHWSWKMMRIQVFSSFVSSCVPFCSFCFSFCGFSVSFSSSSSPLHQMRSRTCCVSFSSLWSHHSKKNQICRKQKNKNFITEGPQTCKLKANQFLICEHKVIYCLLQISKKSC